MAVLKIGEFVERAELLHVPCECCRGSMHEINIYKTDAVAFILGFKKLPKRFKCPDCGHEIKKEKNECKL